MARSAHLACMDCKVIFWLGKTFFRVDDTVDYFLRVGDGTRNWQHSELNRVLWKMLADHAGHPLRVLVEWTEEFNTFMEEDQIVRIGGDDPEHDISIEEYLRDWDG